MTTGNEVFGNFVGTDLTGTQPLGNGWNGVELQSTGSNTIGGSEAGARNIISASQTYNGIHMNEVTGVIVQGNFIGTDVTGAVGIEGSGAYNTVLGNSIHSCAGLGIDLGNDGVTPNDMTDPDIGANNLQNYPELSLAEATPAGLTVSGSLNSRPNQQYRVEFYASSSCDDSGNGEGAIYLGHHSVTTGGSGDAIFTVPTLAGVSNGDAITTTATSVIFSSPRDTLDFSACMLASCLSIAEFGPTLLAPDRASLTWSTPDDVRFVKGPLARVASYSITATGDLPAATSLGISSDTAPPRDGFYYLVRPVACGSWQTGGGEQPERDATLP